MRFNHTLKSIVKGTAFFSLVAPPMGGMIIAVGYLVTGKADIDQALAVPALFLLCSLFSYFIGLLPALATGLIASAAMPYARSPAGFLAICVLGSTTASYACAPLVAAQQDETINAGTALAAISVIPALITGTLWWRLRQRAGRRSMQAPVKGDVPR